MHLFPLPGAPGAGEPFCSRVCSGQHRPKPTPDSPSDCPGLHRGRHESVLSDSWAFFQHLFQCLVVHTGATVQCQPHAPSVTASATSCGG